MTTVTNDETLLAGIPAEKIQAMAAKVVRYNAYRRSYYKENREKICVTRRESHAKNKATVNAKARAYYQQHREVKQSYYQRNKAAILAKAAARRRR